MKRILLVGTYSSRNKGDAAMQLTAATELQRELEGVQVVIATPFPNTDGPFYAPFPVIRAHRRRLVWATLQLGRAWLWRALDEHLGINLSSLISDGELDGYLQADLVVDLSGDMMTEDYGPHVAYSHFIPVLLAGILRRPYVLCAQSIGPFRFTLPIARRMLAGADCITVRDEITMNYLRTLELDGPRLELTADLAFLLQPVGADRVRHILGAEGISVDGPPLLGVSVSQLIESHYRKRNPFSSALSFASVIAAVLDRFVQDLGGRVLFVSHVTGPSRVKDDRRMAQKVQRRMSAPSQVLQGDYSPRDLKGIIGCCRAFLGARMHANIAALSSKVPAVALSYSHKTPGVMRLLGQEELVCDVTSFTQEEILTKLTNAWQHAEDFTTRLSEEVPCVMERARRNIEVIRDAVHSSAGRRPSGPAASEIRS
jgi:colanic acid/amylovoran biosynthesis protein